MGQFLVSAYEWLVCLSEAGVAFLLFKNKFGSEKPKLIFAIAALPIIATSTFVMNLIGLSWALLATINCIIIIAYAFLCFDGKPALKCIWGVVPTIIYCISNFVFLILFYVITDYGVLSLVPGSIVRIVGQLIYMLFNYSILLPLLKIKTENADLPVFLRAGTVVISLIGVAVSMYCYSVLVSPETENAAVSSWIQCSAILFLSISLLVLSGYLSRLYHNHLETQKDLQKAELEAEHVSQVSAMYEHVREWRHDIKGMVSTIKSLAKQEKYQEMEEYLDELGDAAAETSLIVSTGNPAVDAALSAKLMLANKKEIAVNHTVSVPENMAVKTMDICSVIINLLDNAIEAASALPVNERWIDFSLIKKKDMLTFTVSNSCIGKYEYSNDKLVTTKKRSDIHGLGLSRVDSITKKYNGYLLIEPQANSFKATVLIPLGEVEV